jgi:NADPH2:quinone reductase
MRAVVIREFGPPEVLRPEAVAEPAPGDGREVLDVAIANITFIETQIRAGRSPNPAMVPELPAILGNGVGGTLDGRLVVSTTGGRGGYAERVAVDPAAVVVVPAGLALRDAVALLADGRTALALLRAAQIQPGETVLVEAAAGGVGTLLVQLARNAGARVVGAAGGAKKLAVVGDFGADAVVDYTQSDWAESVGDVDVVFDGVGGAIANAAYERVRSGGRFVTYGMASGSFFVPGDERNNVTIERGVPLSPGEMRAFTAAALEEAAAGRIRPVIGQTFALERAADAHRAIETRATIGKTLLEVA